MNHMVLSGRAGTLTLLLDIPPWVYSVRGLEPEVCSTPCCRHLAAFLALWDRSVLEVCDAAFLFLLVYQSGQKSL